MLVHLVIYQEGHPVKYASVSLTLTQQRNKIQRLAFRRLRFQFTLGKKLQVLDPLSRKPNLEEIDT